MTQLVRGVLIVAGTMVYLGLAVLAWGSLAGLLSHPALVVLLCTQLALAVVAALAPGGNLSPGVREDRGNRWVLIPFAVIALLIGVVPAYTDARDILSLDGDAVRWTGLVLFILGGALRLWPLFILRERFSGLVAIQPGHALVTSGPYAVIRHPSYLGLLVNALGWSLCFRSAAGVVLTGLLIPPLLARIAAEERLLRAEFGAAYDAWCARTARLLPGVY
jgi:protein-S-isoprenylcysteine O-methyltransferase Ste14